MLRTLILLIALLGVAPATDANAIRFGDFKFLELGMTAGEVLVRVGAPDHQTVVNTFFVYHEIWYYLPDPRYSGDRLTELTFDMTGRLIDIKRRNPFTREGAY